MAKRKTPHRRKQASTAAAAAAARPLAAHMAGASGASHAGADTRDIHFADWQPLAASPDADLLPDLGTLMSRSRDLGRNNGLMASGLQTLRDNIVGNVLRLAAMPDYRLLGWDRERAREWGNLAEAHFRSWADTTECDAARSQNLLGLTLTQLTGAFLNGDALALPVWLPRPGSDWATRMMLVESDRLATPPSLLHHERIRGGIEFDHYGAPVAYYVLKHHPGDYLLGRAGSGLGVDMDYERIPAFTDWGRPRVLHLANRERTGQSRGKPLVSAVMREFKMAGDYATNELKASVANSLVAAFLESDLDPESAAALFGESPDAVWANRIQEGRAITRRKLEGGAVIPLPVGSRLSSFTPSRPNAAFEAFMLASLRQISASMNLPYELLLKDFSKSNYSSARAALMEAWRYFQGQRRWLMDAWLRPVYELQLEEAISTGRIEAPDFYAKRYAYSRCRFLFGGRGTVDPVKDAQASILRINAGLTTQEAELAEQGLDVEEVLDQLATEERMREARGLPSIGGSAKKPSGFEMAAEPEPEPDPDDNTNPDADPDKED